MTWKRICFLPLAVFMISASARPQTVQPSPVGPLACPTEILSFDPSGVSVRIRNTSGKTIVGLVFNAALSNATEQWKWFHWDFDENRPVRDFGWNKKIKDGQTKRMSWSASLDFEHSGGGAFVLTSVLFEDGSDWQERADGSSCRSLWFKHKKAAFKPIRLPPRNVEAWN